MKILTMEKCENPKCRRSGICLMLRIACHRKKKLGRKVKIQKSYGVLRNIINKILSMDEKTILMTDEFENPESARSLLGHINNDPKKMP